MSNLSPNPNRAYREGIKGDNTRDSVIVCMALEDALSRTYYVYAYLLGLLTCVIWGLTMSYSPHLDGVAIYRLTSSMPTDDLSLTFAKAGDSNRAKNTITTELKMIPYCMFPDVYTQLRNRNTAQINNLLAINWTFGATDTYKTMQGWSNLDFDAWDNPFQIGQGPVHNMPYNLPYDGLDNTLNPQFFSPVCRCMNKVMGKYKTNTLSYDKTTDSLKACMGTRNIIQKQTLIGNDEATNADIAKRKYISRHALLFNLCFAIAFTMIYNRIDFNVQGTSGNFYMGQYKTFIVLILIGFGIPLVSQCFSYIAVAATNSMQFSSFLHLPAALIFLVVELMWGFVAKNSDIRRQTYLHPYSFYMILANLHVIALIENGVFTLEVILTFVLLSNIVALAYAAVLFIAHGKLWQTGGRSELTGYILILMLVGFTCIFHYIPVHPINTELNYLWMLPMVFVVFCFAQIIFLEHLMGEDEDKPETDEGVEEQDKNTKHKKLKFTNSVHLLNTGHTVIVALVLLYYAAQLHYTQYGDMTMTNSGGKLDKRLNFELAELSPTLSYNNIADAQGKYMRST